MAGSTAGGFLLGMVAALLGFAAIMAALRRRNRRALYPETYAAAGGVVYTAVQIGCGGVLLLGGAGLMIVSILFRP